MVALSGMADLVTFHIALIGIHMKLRKSDVKATFPLNFAQSG